MTTLPGKTGIDEQEIAASQNIKERDYWLNQLSGNLVKTLFPVDFKKTTAKGKLFDFLEFRFPDELFSRLMKLSNGYDHMLHMIFLAGVSRCQLVGKGASSHYGFDVGIFLFGQFKSE